MAQQANATRKSVQSKQDAHAIRNHPTTAEIDYAPHEVAFAMGVSAWRTQHPGRFPTNCDLLRIMTRLGWRLVRPDEMVVPRPAGEASEQPALRVYSGG